MVFGQSICLMCFQWDLIYVHHINADRKRIRKLVRTLELINCLWTRLLHKYESAPKLGNDL